MGQILLITESDSSGRYRFEKKKGARLCESLKLTDFGLSFTLKKVKFLAKSRGYVTIFGRGWWYVDSEGV